MKNKNRYLLMVMLLISLLLAPLASAQTGSLAVWENIVDGTLVCDWLETADDVWAGDNDSGIWKYNCTGTAYNVSVNDTTIGDRWYQTFEVWTSDPTHGISAIQTVDVSAPTTKFYAMEYYISEGGITPAAYIVYHEDGTNYYWDTTNDQWDSNVSNATDYSGQQEIDFYSGTDYAKVKALWNWADYDTGDDMNCTARFKIWLNTGDEPRTWMIDDAFTMYGATTEQAYYAGVGANHTDVGSGTTTFRRLFFWNLSWDMDTPCGGGTLPYIGVPQMTSADFIQALEDMTSDDDFYNQTKTVMDNVNTWDLTSFYNESYDVAKTGSQNDTAYIFSILTTGWEDTFETYFDVDEFYDYYEAPFPNNMLILYGYNPTDGTVDESGEALTWTDNFRVRFDFDGDGYDATDYTFLVDGTGTLYGYHGWTQVIPDSPDYWYGVGECTAQSDDTYWGRVFRDDTYPAYYMILNWDLISGDTDAGTCVNTSISFYDNETGNTIIWQDWLEDNDTSLSAHAPSDNATWQEVNTTTYWGMLNIEGSSLDFTDPDDPNDTPSHDVDDATGGNYGAISRVILGLISILIALALLYFIATDFMGKKRKTMKDMLELIKLIFIVLISLTIVVALIAVF